MGLLVMPLAKRAMPVTLQIPEHYREQRGVLLVPRVCIRCRRTLPHVRRVPALPTLPLSNAQMLPTKQLSPVMPDIMGLLAMPLAKRAMLVPLQIRALLLVQPTVLLVSLVRIR